MQKKEDKIVMKTGAPSDPPKVKLKGNGKIQANPSTYEKKAQVHKLKEQAETAPKIKKRAHHAEEEYKGKIYLPSSDKRSSNEKANPIVNTPQEVKEVKAEKEEMPKPEKNTKVEKEEIKKAQKEPEMIDSAQMKTEAAISVIERPRIYKGLCIALVIVSVFLILAAVFVMRPNLGGNGVPALVTVKYEFMKYSKNHQGSYVFKNGDDTVYLNLSDFAAEISLMVIGDAESMRFYKSDGTYMMVKNGSPYVEMNGVELILEAPVVIEDKSVFIPAELFINHTSGLTVDYNMHRERLTVSLVKNKDKSNAVQTVYDEFLFLPRLPENATPIPEPNA